MTSKPLLGNSLLAAMLGMLLVGCASQRPLRTPETPVPAHTAPETRETPPPPSSSTAEPADFWSALRDDFVFARCDSDTTVASWIRRYSAHPRQLQAEFARVLPQMRYVAGLTHAAGIPGEYVLLPWVESNYRALRGKRGKPAGMWQIMPATAMELGLRVDRREDARLNLHESTVAAIRLLQQYQRILGDWRLTTMAYNTGVYRVKKRFAESGWPIDAGHALPEIDVSATTRDHLAKLNALACLIREPGDYGLQLPDPDAAPVVHRVRLANALPLALAARITGGDGKRFAELNAGILDSARPTTQVMVEGDTAAARLRRTAARMDSRDWTNWQRVALHQPRALTDFTTGDTDGSDLLGEVNNLPVDAPLTNGTRVWLPASLAATLPAQVATLVPVTIPTHRVVAGDSLWSLARRFGVRIAELRAWNQLRGDRLKLGQVLHLAPPDDFPLTEATD